MSDLETITHGVSTWGDIRTTGLLTIAHPMVVEYTGYQANAVDSTLKVWREEFQERVSVVRLALAVGHVDAERFDPEQFRFLSTKLLADAPVGIATLQQALDWVLATGKTDPAGIHLGSVPLVQLAGFVFGGWMMGRAALVSCQKVDLEPFYKAKLAAAGFYASHVLLTNLGLLAAVTAGRAAMKDAECFTGR
jgi:hypothetical protein